ncbi:hypothetical protein ACSBOB_08975 [Mesorhizobium sp. ASY16-5R]|uniref:hypothetical protein n=1 Tax=Mesorhizobium sp. ASY16-5R TaxID=3445772 RepID=UPI003F9F32AA
MRTVTGLFDTRDQANRAVEALEVAEIPGADISIISPGDEEASGTAEGVGIGAAVGGAGGLLAGLGAFAIPGIGPFIGAGWLASTLIGVAAGGVAGGLLGSLTDAGVDERDAHVYAEGMRRGGTLVTARVDDAHVDAAAAILGQSGSVDIADRRSEYETTGWSGYDEAPASELDPLGSRPILPGLPQ